MKYRFIEKLDEGYYHYKTEMGLNVFYVPKKNFDKQYAVFSTDFGSLDNHFIPIGEKEFIKIPDGMAHFLEHKLFEDPKRNIFEEFSQLGASANAFTGFDQTSYLFSTTENFYQSLELLIDFVQNPYFTDENVEKEKGIIAQEIKMYDDDPSWRVFFNCMNAMYYEHPVRIDIAGTVDSIANIDKEILYKSYNTFYHPENMVLFIVGDLDPEKIKEVVNKSERKDYRPLGEISRKFTEEAKGVKEHIIIDEMETSTPLFYFGYKEDVKQLKGRDEVRRDLLSNIAIDMLFSSSSPFYNEIYQSGLVDGFGAYYTAKDDYGHALIVGEADDPKLVYERVDEYLSRPCEEILKEEDFKRIKNDEIGGFIMGMDSIEFIAHTGIEMYFSNFSMFEYLALLEEITYLDVIERYKELFNKENVVLSIVNPKQEEVKN